MILATGLLGGHAHFLSWGVVQISLANVIVIVLMLIAFALAVVFRMPDSHDDTRDTRETRYTRDTRHTQGRHQPGPVEARPHVRD